jgi:uncharacterized repeat protein (TIGR01451 family)
VTCGQTTLAPGASTNCSATYTLTQSDIDAGSVANTATACGTPPAGADVCDTDSTSTPLGANKAIDLVKTATPHFSSPPKPGDTIGYSFKITNTGNVSLSGVDLDDSLLGYTDVTCGGVTTLAPGASTTCTGTYTLKQSDIDAGSVSNTAKACGDPPSGHANEVCDTDSTTTTVTQAPALSLTKSANPTTYTAVGDVITYTYVLKNTGNVTLHGPFVVTDNKISGTITCATSSVTLAPGATLPGTCTATYTIQAGDVNASFTGSVTNKATGTAKDPKENTVTSNEATATVRQTGLTAKIAPTATTCQQFTNGTAADLETLTYGVKGGKVNNVAPGVLFYFSKISNAPSTSFTITVPQSNNGGWGPMPIQNTGQIVLYNADCTKSSRQGTTTYNKTSGLVTVNVNSGTAGTYILGIKYSPSDLAGQAVTAPFPTVTYSFSTALNGSLITTSVDSVKVMPK